MIDHPDTRHQVEHGIALLLNDDIAHVNIAVIDIGQRRLDRVLPAHLRAQLQVVELRHLIGGGQLQRLGRQPGAGVVALVILDIILGIAAAQRPLVGDLARHFQLETGRGGIDAGIIAASGLARSILAKGAGIIGQPLLLGAEHGGGGIEAIAEPAALDAALDAGALGRFQLAIIGVDLGLRIIDVGIAGIKGDVGRHVIEQAEIGADLVVVARLIGAIGIAGRLDPHRAGADHALQLVGEVEMRRTIEAGQFVAIFGGQIFARIIRLGHLRAAPVIDRRIDQRAVLGEILPLLGVRLGVGEAQHQLVLAAEQAERAGGAEIAQILLIVGRVDARHAIDALAGFLVGIAIGIEQLRILLEALVGEHPAQRPLAHGIDQLAKAILVLRVPIGPVGRGGCRARIVDPGAVGEDQRHRPPHHAVGVIFLARVTDRRLEIGRHLPGDDRAKDVAIDMVIVEMRVAILMRIDKARRDRIGDRDIEVALHPPQVARAQLDRPLGLELVERPLADIVDRRRRVADAGHDRIGAAHRLDILEQGGVEVAELDTPGERQADAVDLEVGHVETARVEIGAIRLDALDIDADRLVEQVVDIGDREILDPLAIDDRHRLRRLAHRQRQGSGGTGRLVGGGHDDARRVLCGVVGFCRAGDMRHHDKGKAAAQQEAAQGQTHFDFPDGSLSAPRVRHVQNASQTH